MYRQKLLDKINEQKAVYEKVLSGDFETVRYKKGYSEDREHSFPTFHYILDDSITVEE